MQQPSGQPAADSATLGQQQPYASVGAGRCSLQDRSREGCGSTDGCFRQQQSICCHRSRNGQTSLHRVAATERQDALTSLVDNAHTNLAKQPLLVCHLARQTGLLHLLCKEVLSLTTEAATGDAPAADGSMMASMQLPDGGTQSRARHRKLQQVSNSVCLRRDLPTVISLK